MRYTDPHIFLFDVETCTIGQMDDFGNFFQIGNHFWYMDL